MHLHELWRTPDSGTTRLPLPIVPVKSGWIASLFFACFLKELEYFFAMAGYFSYFNEVMVRVNYEINTSLF